MRAPGSGPRRTAPAWVHGAAVTRGPQEPYTSARRPLTLRPAPRPTVLESLPPMQPPRVDVTVITVSHEHWADLRDHLPRVLGPAERCSRHVIVVDNACEDGTA